MTSEHDEKRPLQEAEPSHLSRTQQKASKALDTVTSTAQKIQRRPVIAHLIRAAGRSDRMSDGSARLPIFHSYP